MSEPKLFTPLKVGDITLPNRIAMAPLTRNRALPEGDIPREMNVEYYAQRATAGLIISEGTQISPQGKGYAFTPGIYSPAQVEGWKRVTAAVHAKGGHIAAQLWHVGRVSIPALQPDGQDPVGPSDIPSGSRTYDGQGFVPTSKPRALRSDEIPGIIADYVTAARNARDAGFDMVEIHAANGYLIDQFLRDAVNTRTDAYGGSAENRVRLLDEVVAAVVAEIGAGRVGVRLSPWAKANNAPLDSDVPGTYGLAVDVLNRHGVAFLHVIEGMTGGAREDAPADQVAALRERFDGVYMANNGYDRQMAIDAVDSGRADMVSFGKLFIANPDLVERLEQDAPLNAGDQKTFYGGGREGYTDYPFLETTGVA